MWTRRFLFAASFLSLAFLKLITLHGDRMTIENASIAW